MLPEEGVTALVEKARSAPWSGASTCQAALPAPVAAGGQTVGTLPLLDGETEVLTVPDPGRGGRGRGAAGGGLFAHLLRMAVFAG